jgi:hypothetical protein
MYPYFFLLIVVWWMDFLSTVMTSVSFPHLANGQSKKRGKKVLVEDDVAVGRPRLCDQLRLFGAIKVPEVEVPLNH